MTTETEPILSTDELRAVKSVGEPIEPSSDTLARVKVAMLAQLDHPTIKKPVWKRVAKISVAAVLVLILGIVATLTIKLPNAQAEEMMSKAAQVARDAKEPPLGPHQYRKITLTGLWSSTTMDQDNKEITWMDKEIITKWIPVDQSREWVMHRTGRIPQYPLTPGAEKGMKRESPMREELLRARNGEFYGPNGQGSWQSPDQAFLDGLPKDSEGFYTRLTSDAVAVGTFAGMEDEAFTLIRDLLLTGRDTAEIRALMYSALGRLKGVEVHENATTFDGRKVFGLGFNGILRGERRQLVFDATTFEWVGAQTVITRPYAGLQVGTVVSEERVTHEVVDSAP